MYMSGPSGAIATLLSFFLLQSPQPETTDQEFDPYVAGEVCRALDDLVADTSALSTDRAKQVDEVIVSLAPHLESALLDVPARRGPAADGPRQQGDDKQVPQSDVRHQEKLTAVLAHFVERQPESEITQRGVELLLSRQEPDGSWLDIALCTSRALGILNACQHGAGREQRELAMTRARQWLKEHYARQPDKAHNLDIYSFALKRRPDESEGAMPLVRIALRHEFLAEKINLSFPCEFQSYRLLLVDEGVSHAERSSLARRLAADLLRKSWADTNGVDLVDTALSLSLLSACRELVPERAQDIAPFLDKWTVFVIERLREMAPAEADQPS